MNDYQSALGSNWQEEELDKIVADYFAMLSADLAGRPYVKRNFRCNRPLLAAHASILDASVSKRPALPSSGDMFVAPPLATGNDGLIPETLSRLVRNMTLWNAMPATGRSAKPEKRLFSSWNGAVSTKPIGLTWLGRRRCGL